MKKFVTTLLALAMLLSCSVTAFASESPIPGAAPGTSVFDFSDIVQYDDTLNASRIMPFGLSVPSTYHNLANGGYSADLQEVRTNWLYTNSYFYCNSSGVINVSFTIYAMQQTSCKMNIGLYDIDQGKFVATWLSSAASPSGLSESCYFYNLDRTHRYAVAFTAKDDGWARDAVRGSAYIFH